MAEDVREVDGEDFFLEAGTVACEEQGDGDYTCYVNNGLPDARERKYEDIKSIDFEKFAKAEANIVSGHISTDGSSPGGWDVEINFYPSDEAACRINPEEGVIDCMRREFVPEGVE